MNLEHLRAQIDQLDAEIVRLLNERIEVVQQIGNEKKESGGEIYVPSRERAVFDKISELNKGLCPLNQPMRFTEKLCRRRWH